MVSREINGIKVAYNSIDWTGHTFERIKVLKLVGRHTTRRTLVWLAECSCGNTLNVTSAELASGDTKSCGCLKIELAAARKTTHGMAGTREQKAWKRMKGRCLNPNSSEYEVYSKIGVSENFKSFVNFYEDIGPIPEDIKGRVSVDRKDNTKGYVEGNVRWASDEMQARNKGMYANNSSGVTGVRLHVGSNGREYWSASWYPWSGKSKSRYFSIEKYGDELAFFAACEYRGLMIERLNLAGAGYTENMVNEEIN